MSRMVRRAGKIRGPFDRFPESETSFDVAIVVTVHGDDAAGRDLGPIDIAGTPGRRLPRRNVVDQYEPYRRTGREPDGGVVCQEHEVLHGRGTFLVRWSWTVDRRPGIRRAHLDGAPWRRDIGLCDG